MKQKIIARLLSVCMIFSLIPAAAFAVDAGKTAINTLTATATLPTEAGKDLPTTVTFSGAPEQAQLEGTIAWNDGATTTEAGKTYTGTVTVTVKNNDAYYFVGGDTTAYKLNGDVVLSGGNNGEQVSAITGEVKVTIPPVDEQAYTVTVGTITNGTVKTDVETAKAGATVTVTATPDANYALNKITVTDADGKEVTVTNGTFTMPASNVTVTATFVKVEVEVIEGPVVNENPNANIADEHKDAVTDSLKATTVEGVNKITAADLPALNLTDVPEDATVTVTVSVAVHLTATALVQDTAANTTSFKVDITPVYQVKVNDDVKHNGEITNVAEALTITVPLPIEFTPVAVRHLNSDNTLKELLDFTFANNAVTFAMNSFSEVDITNEAQTFKIAYYKTDGSEKISEKSYESKDINNVNLDVSPNGRGWATEANSTTLAYKSGALLNNDIFVALLNAYSVLEDATALPLYEVKSSGSSSNGGGSGSGGGASSGSNHAISVGSPANGKISVIPANAGRGTSVTINLTPDAGYVVGTVTVTDANGNRINVTRVNDTRYTFTMPAGRVTVNATFVRADANMPFTDVANGEYYYDAVLWAVAKGITTGTSETRFSPNVACTRAQIVTFLWRAAGSPVVTGSNPFTDVASNEYYYNAVLWAVRQGITTGTSASSFSPNATCNRAQTVTFLYRYAGSPAVSGSSSFGDVAANEYYTSAVNWAVAQGVTNGTSTNAFSPANDCTRGHVVTFLYRYMGD